MPTLQPTQSRFWIAAVSVAAAGLLAACDRQAETTAENAERRADTVIADAGKTAGQVGNEVRQEARQAGQAVADKAKDIGISTEIKTLLARDDQLSALKIDVDTNAGQVVLQGTAPSDAARAHASDLARSVSGVLGVDNKLQVKNGN